MKYFVIRNGKKVVEFYDMTTAGPMTTYMSREILNNHLKKGQTFHEESKCPVRIRKKKTNILAQAVSMTTDAPTVVQKDKIGY